MEIESESENSKFKFGHTFFSGKFLKHIYPNLNDYVLNMLSQQDWIFLLEDDWVITLPEIRENQCLAFKSYYTYPINFPSAPPPVIQLIGKATFICLKELTLQANQIISIEALAFLSIDTIKKVNLKQNMISCFKAINKANWPKIHYLNLSDNQMTELQISRVRMKKENYRLYFGNKNHLAFEGYGFFLKASSEKIQLAEALNTKIIFQQKVFLQLSHKSKITRIGRTFFL